ncbi:MAG: rubredoxin [Myxococcota bacterium]|nr:rubredoxin [Myxococcota bacterium]
MASEGGDFKKYECVVCGYIYDEALGIPSRGIPAGTRWDDLPDDFECPECACKKEYFQLIG